MWGRVPEQGESPGGSSEVLRRSLGKPWSGARIVTKRGRVIPSQAVVRSPVGSFVVEERTTAQSKLKGCFGVFFWLPGLEAEQ